MKALGKARTVRRLRPAKAGVLLAGAGAALLVFVLYVRTLAPGVLTYSRPDLPDAAMLQVHAASLGITHPTGYPAYTMLTHLFTELPFGSPAYLANLASAVYGACAVALVYAAGYLLTRNVIAAAAGALSFGLGQTLWSQATIAEVYPLNALFIALTIAVLLLWRSNRDDRYLLAACFFMGLSLANHLTSGLLLPAGALFVALVDRRKLLETRLALKGAGLFALGLTPYLYLPIRAAMRPESMEADPSTVGGFFALVSGARLNGRLLTLRPGSLLEDLSLYGEDLLENFPWLLLAAGFAGLVVLLRRDRPSAALTGSLFGGWLLYALAYTILDVQLYFIPTYLVLALWVSVGLAALLDTVRRLVATEGYGLRLASYLPFAAAALLLPLVPAAETYAEVDRTGQDEGLRIIEAVAENVEQNATVIHHRSSLWYMVVVQGRRQDLTLVDPYYPSWGPRHYDAAWPGNLPPDETDRRHATSRDDLGVAAAEKAAEMGPVYILDQGLVGGSRFREAGFDVVPVERGLLYELVPPDGRR